MSEEKKLIKHLLDNYKEVGNGGRPVLNITTVMEVEFGLGLIQMDLDERYKVLKMSMWSRYVSKKLHELALFCNHCKDVIDCSQFSRSQLHNQLCRLNQRVSNEPN